MNAVEVLPKEQIDELKQALPVLPFAKIETQVQLNQAVELRGEAKKRLQKVEDFFNPRIDQAHKLHKGLLADKKLIADPIQRVHDTCKNMMDAHARAEADRIAAEQRKLDEEARQQAEDAARKEREAAQRALAEARKAGDAEAKKAAERQAEEARQKVKDIASGATVIQSSVTVQAQSATNVSVQVKWSADDTVDLIALVRAAGRDTNLLPYLLPNMVALNKVMSATKGQIVIPGVRAISKTITAQR